MDLLGSRIATAAVWLPLILFAAFLLLEWRAPFRTAIQSKLQHVSTNLVLFGTNSLAASLITGWVVFLRSEHWKDQNWGLLHHFHLGPISLIAASIILLDVTLYAFHWLNHRVPVLWRFHRAHHTDLDMDVTTSVRFHIGEALITTVFKVVAVMALGIPTYGLLVSETTFLAAGQFQHSNIRVPLFLERWIRFVLVTPPMHWIHHSRRPAEHHSNFGVMISTWDRWFRTYRTGVRQSEIHFGLDEYSKPEDVAMLRFYRIPLDPAEFRAPGD